MYRKRVKYSFALSFLLELFPDHVLRQFRSNLHVKTKNIKTSHRVDLSLQYTICGKGKLHIYELYTYTRVKRFNRI